MELKNKSDFDQNPQSVFNAESIFQSCVQFYCAACWALASLAAAPNWIFLDPLKIPDLTDFRPRPPV